MFTALWSPKILIAEHIVVPPEKEIEQIEEKIEPEKPNDIIQKITDIANKYNVNSSEMIATIKCESGFENIQSHIVDNGIREDSHGIVQIHLPSNPGITIEQAYDIDFSLEFMAKSFSEGKQRLWSCYRQLFL